jgi:kynurenine formamidase
MAAITEKATGLKFYELSQPFGHGVPVWPGDDDVKIWKSVYHSKHGVQSYKLNMNMHCSTFMTAPIHLIQGGAFVSEVPITHFFGSGVVLDIPKGKWELVTVKDLEAAKPGVEDDDIVIICTGWHKKYADSQEYFGHAPGLSEEAADWLIAKGAKLVAVDAATIDHPLATTLGGHRGGPLMKYLPGEYKTATGREAAADYPKAFPAQKKLLEAGIPTIQSVGGDVAQLKGKRGTFHAMPWRWYEGDACVVHLVGIEDPSGNYRIESGTRG